MKKVISVIKANKQHENNIIKKLKVAAYCRVSTDSLEQENSYKEQISYYKQHILGNENYELAGIFADKGITGTSIKNRIEFNKMINCCREGKIDKIITKSISRFGRNTVDVLNTIRELKELNIGVYFEKENIDSLSSTGELMLTILISLAQEESKSISSNVTWGIRKMFQKGEERFSYTNFMGYEKQENGEIVIIEKEAAVIRLIFEEFLKGRGYENICKTLEEKNIKSPYGADKWRLKTVREILENERYKGDLVLQKTYTKDFLNKKIIINDGNVDKYYIENNHPPIISKEMWDCVTEEKDRLIQHAARHNIKGRIFSGIYALSNKIICEECGCAYIRARYKLADKSLKYYWYCNDKVCHSKNKRYLLDEKMKDLFVKTFNTMLNKKATYIEIFEMQLKEAEGLKKYNLEQNIQLLKDGVETKSFSENTFIIMVEKIIVGDKFKFVLKTGEIIDSN